MATWTAPTLTTPPPVEVPEAGNQETPDLRSPISYTPSTKLQRTVAGREVIGRQISVWNIKSSKPEWVEGRVEDYDENTGKHGIRFVGDTEATVMLNLADYNFAWLTPSPADAAPNPSYLGSPIGDAAVGRKVRVFWPMMKRYYQGQVKSYDPATDSHLIFYRDGEKKTHVLKHEAVVWLDDDAATGKSTAQSDRSTHALSTGKLRKPAPMQPHAGSSEPQSGAANATVDAIQVTPKPATHFSNGNGMGRNGSYGVGNGHAKEESASGDTIAKCVTAAVPNHKLQGCSSGSTGPNHHGEVAGSWQNKTQHVSIESSSELRENCNNMNHRQPTADGCQEGATSPDKAPGVAGGTIKAQPTPPSGRSPIRSRLISKPLAQPLVQLAAARPGRRPPAPAQPASSKAPKTPLAAPDASASASTPAVNSTKAAKTGSAGKRGSSAEPQAGGSGSRGGKQQAQGTKRKVESGPAAATKRASTMPRKLDNGGDYRPKEDSAGDHPRKKQRGAAVAAAGGKVEAASDAEGDYSVIVGTRVGIYWKEDNMYYRGKVIDYNERNQRHLMHYDDGEKEWLALDEEQFKWYGPKGVSAGCKPAMRGIMAQLGAEGIDAAEDDEQPAAAPSHGVSGDAIPKDSAAVGGRVQVLWSGDNKWHSGEVLAVDPKRGSRHLVLYSDGEHEWLELPAETAVWERPNRGSCFCAGICRTAPAGRAALGWKVGVYWRDDMKFYDGKIIGYDSVTGRHQVVYEDGEEESISLHGEKVVWKLPGGFGDKQPANGKHNTKRDSDTNVAGSRRSMRKRTEEESKDSDDPDEPPPQKTIKLNAAAKPPVAASAAKNAAARRPARSKDPENSSSQVSESHQGADVAAATSRQPAAGKQARGPAAGLTAHIKEERPTSPAAAASAATSPVRAVGSPTIPPMSFPAGASAKAPGGQPRVTSPLRLPASAGSSPVRDAAGDARMDSPKVPKRAECLPRASSSKLDLPAPTWPASASARLDAHARVPTGKRSERETLGRVAAVTAPATRAGSAALRDDPQARPANGRRGDSPGRAAAGRKAAASSGQQPGWALGHGGAATGKPSCLQRSSSRRTSVPQFWDEDGERAGDEELEEAEAAAFPTTLRLLDLSGPSRCGSSLPPAPPSPDESLREKVVRIVLKPREPKAPVTQPAFADSPRAAAAVSAAKAVVQALPAGKESSAKQLRAVQTLEQRLLVLEQMLRRVRRMEATLAWNIPASAYEPFSPKALSPRRQPSATLGPEGSLTMEHLPPLSLPPLGGALLPPPGGHGASALPPLPPPRLPLGESGQTHNGYSLSGRVPGRVPNTNRSSGRVTSPRSSRPPTGAAVGVFDSTGHKQMSLNGPAPSMGRRKVTRGGHVRHGLKTRLIGELQVRGQPGALTTSPKKPRMDAAGAGFQSFINGHLKAPGDVPAPAPGTLRAAAVSYSNGLAVTGAGQTGMLHPGHQAQLRGGGLGGNAGLPPGVDHFSPTMDMNPLEEPGSLDDIDQTELLHLAMLAFDGDMREDEGGEQEHHGDMEPLDIEDLSPAHSPAHHHHHHGVTPTPHMDQQHHVDSRHVSGSPPAHAVHPQQRDGHLPPQTAGAHRPDGAPPPAVRHPPSDRQMDAPPPHLMLRHPKDATPPHLPQAPHAHAPPPHVLPHPGPHAGQQDAPGPGHGAPHLHVDAPPPHVAAAQRHPQPLAAGHLQRHANEAPPHVVPQHSAAELPHMVCSVPFQAVMGPSQPVGVPAAPPSGGLPVMLPLAPPHWPQSRSAEQGFITRGVQLLTQAHAQQEQAARAAAQSEQHARVPTVAAAVPRDPPPPTAAAAGTRQAQDSTEAAAASPPEPAQAACPEAAAEQRPMQSCVGA